MLAFFFISMGPLPCPFVDPPDERPDAPTVLRPVPEVYTRHTSRRFFLPYSSVLLSSSGLLSLTLAPQTQVSRKDFTWRSLHIRLFEFFFFPQALCAFPPVSSRPGTLDLARNRIRTLPPHYPDTNIKYLIPAHPPPLFCPPVNFEYYPPVNPLCQVSCVQHSSSVTLLLSFPAFSCDERRLKEYTISGFVPGIVLPFFALHRILSLTGGIFDPNFQVLGLCCGSSVRGVTPRASYCFRTVISGSNFLGLARSDSFPEFTCELWRRVC